MAVSTITFDYVGTEDQLANMLTKALGTKKLELLFEASGIRAKAAQH